MRGHGCDDGAEQDDALDGWGGLAAFEQAQGSIDRRRDEYGLCFGGGRGEMRGGDRRRDVDDVRDGVERGAVGGAGGDVGHAGE